jgi:hypothetical protein
MDGSAAFFCPSPTFEYNIEFQVDNLVRNENPTGQRGSA